MIERNSIVRNSMGWKSNFLAETLPAEFHFFALFNKAKMPIIDNRRGFEIVTSGTARPEITVTAKY